MIHNHVHPSSFPQLVQGPQANVIIAALPTLAGHTPRSWNLSADGSLVVVGFLDGALQVYTCVCTFGGMHVYTCMHTIKIIPKQWQQFR